MFENLDWDKLKVFGVVVEFGSMNVVVNWFKEIVLIVFWKIDDLECMFNVCLFYCLLCGVMLIEVGKKVLWYVEIMLDVVDGLCSDVLDYDLFVEGFVILCMGDGLVLYWIVLYLLDFYL